MSFPFFTSMDIPQELSQGEPVQMNSVPAPMDSVPEPISTVPEPTDTLPAPINAVPEREFWVNEIPGENNDFTPLTTTEEKDIANESNGFTPVAKENDELPPGFKENDELPRIEPCTGGVGLPYAPVNWPNPGDSWNWRVGRRVNAAGYYHDRFLIIPASLQKRNVTKSYGSKHALERFIRKEIPGADIDAFFASFVWKVPATIQAKKKEETGSLPAEIPQEGENGKVQSEGKGVRRTQRKIPEKPKETPLPQENSHSSKRKRAEKPTKTTPSGGSTQTTQKTRRNSKASARTSGGAIDFSLNAEAKPAVEPIIEVNPEEFANYLSTLDALIEPTSQSSMTLPIINISPINEHAIVEAKRKLSSLLDMDFPRLVVFQDLNELTNLASIVREDPRLTAEQLVKLKLIEDMPSFCEVYIENKGVIEQADQFFQSLEFNKSKVASLKNEYSDLRNKVGQLQIDIDSNSMIIKEIDEQIRLLQARKAELTTSNKNKKKEKEDVNYAQNMVANSIPKVVEEIQIANSKKAEWELKKVNAIQRESEILQKFAPLKGFYL